MALTDNILFSLTCNPVFTTGSPFVHRHILNKAPAVKAGLRLSLLTCIIAIATPALAQTTTSALCQQLATHTPADDVAYQPGFDMQGRYVAPADLPDSAGATPQNYLPKTYNVLITVDQAAKLNLPSNTPYKAEAIAAMVQVQPNGTVSINGQTLNAQQQQVLCR